MMENNVRERMIETLKGYPQGLTIQEVSKLVRIGRVTVKYVHGPSATSQRVGPAKLCCIVVR
jgi:hypothetical protein